MATHRHRIRVRYAESDQMGVAHHGAYIAWFEEARIEWLRSCGFSYRTLETEGILLPVIGLEIDYRRALRFDDVIDLVTSAEILGPSRIRFTTRINLIGEETLRAEGRVTLAAVDRDGRPCRLREDLVTQVT